MINKGGNFDSVAGLVAHEARGDFQSIVVHGIVGTCALGLALDPLEGIINVGIGSRVTSIGRALVAINVFDDWSVGQWRR